MAAPPAKPPPNPTAPHAPQPPYPLHPTFCTIEPITSPTGSNSVAESPAAEGTVSIEVHGPPDPARATRAAATGGNPRPSH